ncbi:MAG: HD domain-containing phosphohydrolase [Solirubrobacteraceae bacterium]|jgi:PAS domain S-box-containing protein
MTARRQLERPRSSSYWQTLDGPRTIVAALVLFVGFYVVQAQDTRPADALEVLYTLPIALLALRFGLRGGLAGALVGLALIGTYDYTAAMFDATVLGDLCWAIAFLLLGLLLGSYVDHRRRLEADLARCFESSLDLLTTIDQSGRFTNVNPACERILGYSAEAMYLRPTAEFVHPDDQEATAAEHCLLTGGSHETVAFRNRFRCADGDYRWLEWSAATSSEGVIFATARDITVQHEAEERLANHAQILEAEVAERTSELEDSRAKMLHRLALAAEYRDDDTFEHTGRVAATSVEIATRLGLDRERIALLREAAPLHDVGKIAIPDCILLKPGKLTPQEFEVMKTHAALGARLLAGGGSPVLQMAAVIAESHHERWDGAGYPAGLTGEAIPFVGRVVAVADVFDALTSDRPYKPAWPVERALAEIQDGAGSQFDPEVVAAFLAIQRERTAGAQHSRPRVPAHTIDAAFAGGSVRGPRAGAHA